MLKHIIKGLILFSFIFMFSFLLDFFYYGLNIDKSFLRNIHTIHWKLIGAILCYLIFYSKNILKGKMKNPNKQPLKQYSVFFTIAIYECLYLLYTYLIADPISLKMGADGFLENNTTPIIILFSVFLAPTFEELICRSFLNKKLSYLWVFILFLGFCGLVFNFSYPTISLLFLVLIILIFFYFSSFLFAFAHVSVIDSVTIELTFLTKSFIAFISIFPISIILGKIRVRFGLGYSILLHCINNALILTINNMVYF